MARGRGPFAGGLEQARRQLIKAAEACFADYGLTRTRMDDVARRAGVSRPTVYRYFRDRDALVAAVIERRATRFAARAREYIGQFPEFADKVVEGLAFAIAAGRGDEIVSKLVEPESLSLATDVLTGSNFAQELTDELWRPIFEAAQSAGQMRPELDPFEISSWFSDIELMLVGRPDLVDAGDTDFRETIRHFVLPALLPDVG
ncbi:TetR/AcrR family transcriptional regulator [Pseudonocardia spinosispora]|uniref:TetR/AcrR family transcriptional regulator n=1 Tax=Pseudonocardia spinosispora TaxID=103441 RepID=UPI000491F8C1|nr:TetR/AcrR family transcriptional regulator [Pseudonocardia spinosispora]